MTFYVSIGFRCDVIRYTFLGLIYNTTKAKDVLRKTYHVQQK